MSRRPSPFRESAASLPASQTETPCQTRPATKTRARPGSAKAPRPCHESQNGEVLSRREATAKVCLEWDYLIVGTVFCAHLQYVAGRYWRVAAQLLSGAPSSRVGLPSPWQQQRRPGGEGRVSADGRGGGLLCSRLPQLLSFLAAGWPSPRGVTRHGRIH